MNNIPCALESPRVCNRGYIHWYEGDTFVLTFEIDFVDENGKSININDTDIIIVSFKDKYQNTIHEFTSVGSNKIVMDFTKEVSNKFTIGEYTYCARLNNGWIKTFMRNNIVLVE